MVPRNDTKQCVVPPELCDYILDHLWDHRSVLAACGLACRAFLPTTRYHLFHKIDLTVRRRREQFERLLSTSPAIGEYVKDLSTNGHALQSDSRPHFLFKLSKIERLCICNWVVEDVSEDTRRILRHLLSTVRTLRLQQVNLDHQTLMRLLSACRHLSDLRLWAVCLRLHESWPFVTDLVPADSECVEIDTMSSWAFTGSAALSQTGTSLKLRLSQLEINCAVSAHKAENAGNLLRAAGASLQRLVLTVRSGSCGEPWSDHLSLATNTRLSSLHLKDGMMSAMRIYSRRSSEYPLGWVSCALDQAHVLEIPLQRIQISVRLFCDEDWDEYNLEWERVDETLAQLVKKLPGLEIVFCVCRSEPLDGWAIRAGDVVCQRVPHLLESGNSIGVWCCREWTEDAALGGYALGPVRKQWYP